MKPARDSSLTRGFGPFRNRGIGSDRGAGGMSVHATIIDLKEMDDAILAEAAAGLPGAPAFDPDAAQAELLARHVGTTLPCRDQCSRPCRLGGIRARFASPEVSPRFVLETQLRPRSRAAEARQVLRQGPSG